MSSAHVLSSKIFWDELQSTSANVTARGETGTPESSLLAPVNGFFGNLIRLLLLLIDSIFLNFFAEFLAAILSSSQAKLQLVVDADVMTGVTVM